ncbi:YadA-like family protein [Bisgaard Taxon 10/6]|uniref:YadA-like family protein n=1 Tax=Exercitatus varius TaxID=67857 RepID=UPI00294AF04F|nr:YadA-like family protein [Exercitatus varius]MDG2953328.1 YadA-like family protein [Exercitatus varius]
MNHIYKVIWSKITQSLVVVSELATNQGKAHSSTSRSTVTQSSLAKSSFKLSAVSALLMAAMPAANAAVSLSSTGTYNGSVWVSASSSSATGASVPYNYGTPNNTNYPGQSNSNIYSGSLGSAQSISIGANTNAISGSIAFGDYSNALGGLSLALGPYSRTTQAGAIALGTSALASGFDSFAAMRQAAATADFAMAMGTAANANGNSSIAMGSSALALGSQSIAIGSAAMNKSSGSGGEDSYTTRHNNVTNTKAQGDRTIALGVNTSTTSNDSIAIGTNTKTNGGTGAIAIGWCSSTSYQDSVAMGSNATANGTYTVALGYNATSTNSSSISIGWNSAATNTQGGPSQGSVAIGPSTVAKGNQSVALGAVAQAAEQATAIGNDARASGFGSIVIGGDDTGYSSNKSSDPYTYASTGNVIGYLPYDSANSTYSNYRTSVSSGVGAVTVGVHGQALSQGSTAIGVYATAGDNGEYIADNTTTTNAIEATAIGAMARAKSKRSTAIGYSADALNEEATAIGSNATANSTDSMALGSNSTANGSNSLAAGYNATTNGLNALAIGSSAQALAENAISIGTGNIVTGKNSGAIGDPTTISGEGSYSLGNNNTIPDDNSTVVGNDNVLSQGDSGASTSDGSHVVGNNAKVRGTNSIAMGNNVVVGDALYETGEVSTNATAIGTYSKANGVNALALGTGATAYHTNNTVIGTNATVGRSAGTDNIAFGSNTNVTSGNNSVVIGKDSKSEAINGSSIALGNNASISSGVQQNGYAIGTNANIASTNGGIAFGTNATITNSNGGEGASVAIGENATATGTSSISIGYNANSSGSQRDSIAIGTNATASGLDNIAIGKGASASGSQGSHVVIGTKANATGAESIVVGANANATGSQAEQIVIGSNATATSTSQYGIVMGSNATASREYSTVLGANTDSTVDGGVALGANSKSTRGYSGSATAHPSTITPYIPDTASTAQSDAINATKATTGAVSVGSDTVKRQIINVAAGSEDSDAVNVAQLKAAVSSTSWNLQNNGVQKDEIKSGDTVNFVNGTGTVAQVTGNSTNSTVKYSVDTTGLNVASDGTVSAVKNGDKFATAEQVAKAINDSEKTTTVNSTNGTIAATATTSGTVTNYDLDLSQAAKDSLAKADSALQSWTAQVNGSTAKVVNQTNNTVNFVNGTNTVVSADTNGNIRVSTAENVTFNTVNATTFNAGDVSISNNGINAGGKVVTNVANGTKDSDAVNLSQLNATNTNVANNAQNITNNANNISNNTKAIANNTQNITTNANNIAANTAAIKQGFNIGADKGNDDNVQLGETVNYNGDSNIITTVSDNAIAFALNSSIAVDNVTVNDTFKTGDVTINNAGIDAGNHTITNVTAGTNATDAVNLAQLNASQSSVKAGDNVNVTSAKDANGTVYTVNANTSTVSNGSDKVMVTKTDAGNHTNNYAVDLSDAAKASLTKADSALQSWTAQVNGAEAKVVNQTSNTVNFVNGTNTVASADASGNISVSTAENVTFNTVNASTFNAGDVTINNSGINAGNHTITNVANGTKDSDAVNLSQLNATNTNVANNAQNITNNANNISNNTKAIANNTQNITTNANNIAANTAAIKQGFNIGADKGVDDNVKLGETVNYNGDSNIITTVSDNAIAFALNSSLNLTDAGSVTMGDVVVNNGGITIANGSTNNQAVSLTKDGLNNGGNKITNVANGTQDSDAVNLAQLNASQSSVKAGDNVNVTSAKDANGTVYTVNANTSTVSNGSDKVTVTKTDAGNHTSNYAVDLSQSAKDSLTKADSALQSWTAQVNGADAKVVNQTNNTVNFVNGTNTVVSADANGNISVSTADNVTFNTVNASTFNAGDVSISSNGINAGGKVVTNVANGTKDSDAVNLSQLNATNTNVANNAQNITNNTNAIANNTQNITNNTNAINKGINFGNGTKANNFALGSTINVTSDSNLVVSTVTDGVKLTLADSITVGNVTVNDTFKAGDVTINSAGIDAGNHAITNVTAGTNATDAVNVAQLNASQSSVKAGDNVNVTSAKDANGTVYTVNANTSTVSNGSDKVTVTKTDAGNHTSNYAVDLSQSAKDSLTKADSALQSLTTSADGNQAQTLNQENSNANFISGNNIQLTPSANGITVATKADVTFTNVTATNVNGNTVTIGSGANTTTLTSTAEGLDVGGDKLTNISAGTNATDAVNVGQLEKYIGDNSYNWNLSDGTNNNAVADNSTVAIKGSANADSAKTVGIVTALDGTNVSVDLSEQTKSDIQQGVDANTTVNNKGITFAADSGAATERKLGESLAVNGDGDLINTTASAGKIEVAATDKLKNAVTNATSALQSVVTQIDGKDVKTLNKADNKANFVSGDNISLTNDGQGGIKIATKENVTFNTVNASTFNAGDVSISSNGINAGGKTVTNVANGTKDSDAVNLSQLNATNTNVANNAQNITNNTNAIANNTQNITNNTNAINKGINFGNGTSANKFALGSTINVKPSDSNLVVKTVADGVELALADSIAVSNVTVNDTFKAGDVTINSAGIDAGNHAITNVTAGTNATDAVNLGQLEKYIGDNSYNWNLSDGTNSNAVADNSTVAIKGSANADSAKTAGIVTALDGTNVSVDLSDKTKSDIQQGVNANTTVSKGFNIGADKGVDDNVKLGETVNYNGDSNIITTVSNNAIAFALNPSLNLTDAGSVTMGDVVVNNGGITIANGTTNNQTVSLTKDGLNNGGNKITNVANGTQDSDAVNLAQLNASQSSVKAGDNVNVTSAKDANGTVYTVNANTSTVSNGSDKVTVTKTDAGNHTSNYAVDLSQSAKDSLTKADSALQSWTAQVNGAEAKVVNQTSNTVNFVNGTNTVVSADASGNISVSTAENVTFNTVNASTFNAGDVTINNSGINAGNHTITNVANGTKDSDAVNFSQLNATNTNVANNAQNITNNANNITNNTNAIANNTQNITNNTNAINKGINFGNGTKANNFALGSTINVTSDSNLVVSTVTDGVKLTLADSIAVGNVTVNDTFKAGNVTINNSGIDAGNHAITNVTAGTNATDAVNVAQLNASQSSVKAGDNVNVTSAKDANGTVYTVNANTSTVSNGSDKVTVTKTDAGNHTSNYAVDLSQSAKDSLTKADSALQSLTTSADGNQAQTLNQENSNANFISGNNIQLTPSANGITVATKADVTFTNVTATNVNGNTVTIGSGANTTTLTSTAEGLDVGGDKLTNISAGTNATDAVNVAQLEANTTRYYSVNSTATGNRKNDGATGANAMAAGANATASGDNATAIGQGTKANSAAAIAIGNNANATSSSNDSVIAIGNNAQSTGSYSIAVGTNSVASNTWSMAMGISAKATGDYATGLGSNAQAIAQWTTALGAGANATESAATAVGSNATAGADGATVIGYNSSVTGANTTALGNNINVSTEGSVVLGNNSAAATATTETAATVNNLTYSGFAGAGNVTTGDYVSVGSAGQERQIKYVAPGNISANSTDAINGSQLYATNQVLGNMANSVVNNFGGNAAVDSNGNITFTNIGDTGQNTIHDAIKSVSDVANTGWNVQTNGDTATKVAPGDTVQFKDGKNIKITRTDKDITVATADDVSFNSINTSTLTAGPVTINSNGIDAGNQKITNVANGTANSDAVNFGQLKDYVNDNSYNWNLSDGTNSNAVADNSTVAIKGSANADSAKTAGIVTALDGTNVSVDLSEQTKSDIQQGVNANTTVSKGFNIGADKGNDDNVQLGETVNYNGDSNIITTVSDNAIAFALNPSLNLTDAGSVTMGDVVVNNGGITIANGSTNNQAVSLTKDGLNNGGNKITNVVNGTQDSDAVNLAQLNASQSSVKAGDNVNVTSAKDANGTVYTVNANTSTVSNGSDKVTVTKTDAGNHTSNYAVDLSQSAKDSLTKADSALQSWTAQVNGADAKVVNQTSNTVNFVNGTNTVVSADTNGNIRVSTAENVTFNTVNASTFNAGDVSISNNGINAGGKVVTNVANGTKDSDAVNFSQLNATNTNVANNAQNITNNANNITNNTNAINKGINFGNGTTATKFNLGDTINVTSDSNLVVSTVTDGVKLTLADSIKVSNVTVNDTFKAGDVTINNSGIDAGNHAITNVTAGTNATDAVNVGQLEKYVGDNAYNWNLSDGTNTNAVADNSTVAIKGSANADSAKTAGIVTALNGTNVSVDLSEQTKSDIQQGVDANTTVNSKGITFAADSGAATERKLGETLTVNGDNDLINTTASAGKIAVAATDKLKDAVTNATNALQSVVTQIDGTDVKTLSKADNKANFVSGDNISLTNDGNGGIKIATKADVTFTNVTATNIKGNTVTISSGENTTTLTSTKEGLDVGGDKITNVANGTKDSDAVNLSQLNATNANITNVTKGLTWKITGNNATNATTVGNQTVSFNNGTNTVAVVNGTNVTFNLADNITLTNKGSMTIGTTVITSGNIKVGNNVAVTETGFTAGSVSVTTSGINAGGKTITNVARGVADDDAVNVSQLNEVKETANAGWNLTVNGADSSNVKPKDTVDLANKDGNINITKDGNNVTFDLSDKLNIGSGANTVVIDGTTGKVSAGNVSIGKDGISAGGQTITNVAPGVNGTDAVNVDQLRNFTSSVVDKPLTFAGDTGTPSERKMGSTVTVKGGVSDTAKLTDNNIGVVSDGQGSLNVKLAKDLTGLNSVTISNGSASTKLTTVTKKNVEGKEASALDVGGNQITNVAPGEVSKDSTDAVNGSQLHATNQQVIRNANAINQVAGQVHSVDRKLRAGVAGALAAGGLYHATMPGKSMVAAGAGTYRGESAIAVGYSRLSDNGKLGVKFSVNSNTRGDTGAAASVGYQW